MRPPGICVPARVRLHIDSPTLSIQMKSLQGSGLAEVFNLIDVVVASVVPCTWLTLRVFVCQARAQSLNHGHRCEIFRSNKLDALPAVCDRTLQ